MSSSVAICSDKAHKGYINLVPVYDWITRCVLSIFMSFLPLPLQEFTEHELIRSLICSGKTLLSPLFGVFVAQIYANFILTNLAFVRVLVTLPMASDSQHQGCHSIFTLWIRRTIALSEDKEDEDTIDACLRVRDHVCSASGLLLGDRHSHEHLSVYVQPIPVRLHRASTGLSRVLEMAFAWRLHTTSWIS